MKKRDAVVARRARAKSAAKQDPPKAAKVAKAATPAKAAKGARAKRPEPMKVPAPARPATVDTTPGRANAGKGGKNAKAAEKAKPAKKAKTALPGAAADRPRVRGTFAIPEADYARIGSLKLLAKRAGFKVKKNELIRLGLRALQALNDVELQARVLALRDADRAATQG